MRLKKPDYIQNDHVYFYCLDNARPKLGCGQVAQWDNPKGRAKILKDMRPLRRPTRLDMFVGELEYVMLGYNT